MALKTMAIKRIKEPPAPKEIFCKNCNTYYSELEKHDSPEDCFNIMRKTIEELSDRLLKSLRYELEGLLKLNTLP